LFSRDIVFVPSDHVLKVQGASASASEGTSNRLRSQRAVAATAIPTIADYVGPATNHILHCGDARDLDWIPDESVHLVVTSPPYFNLKRYNEHSAQLGNLNELEHFLDEIDKVWRHCYRVLVASGRLVCNVGDVCLARRRNKGRHLVIPLHAHISVRAGQLGFDYLTPILWHKIANAAFEAEGNGGGFLGKPYEPNGVIKNDMEYILMLRKHGAYRQPTPGQRSSSRLTKDEQAQWFRPVWTDLKGESTRHHPAPFPVELAYRLIRMFSFTGDTVLDPFGGTGSTTLAAMQANRNSILNELDAEYFEIARRKISDAASQQHLFRQTPQITVQP
jgi:modification methylase